MNQKLLEMVQVTVLFHTDELIFVWSFKNGNGRQNRSSGASLSLFSCKLKLNTKYSPPPPHQQFLIFLWAGHLSKPETNELKVEPIIA